MIYFDEPASALYPELTGDVLSVMRDLAREGPSHAFFEHPQRARTRAFLRMLDGNTLNCQKSEENQHA